LLPGEIMWYGPNAEYYRRASTGYGWASMSLTPESLANAARALAGRELSAPPVTRRIRPPAHLMSRLLRLHQAAGQLAVNTPDILAHPEVARALEQELVRAMIACLANGTAVERVSGGPRHASIMRRFEDILEANPDKPMYLTEICAAIGTAERTLRLHCQKHLGMGPQRYLWLRRMNLVRRALERADPSATTVTATALDHGFAELGRFAVAYRLLFGEPPSATLRRAFDGRGSAPVLPEAPAPRLVSLAA
jgi:AraC-like DNA-binding protein